MNIKPLHIKKPNHNDWVVLLPFDPSKGAKLPSTVQGSHEPIVRKTIITSIGCQDDMVQNGDIEKLGRLLDFFGQLSVLLAGLQLPGGVVMCQDNAHGKCFEDNGKKNAHVHHGSRDPTMGQWIDALDLIGAIEQKDHEGLVQSYGIGIPVVEQQGPHILGIGDRQ